MVGRRPAGRKPPVAAFVPRCLSPVYGSYYNFAFALALLAGAALAAAVVPGWRRALLGVGRIHWRPLVAAGCLAVVLALPAAIHYLEAAGTLRPRPASAALDALPRLVSYLFVDERSWWYAWMDHLDLFRGLPVRHEHAIGLGFLTTGILLWVAHGFKAVGGSRSGVGQSPVTMSDELAGPPSHMFRHSRGCVR
jgi:hypothetical protein